MTMSNADCARALANSQRLRAMPPHRFVLWATAKMGSVQRALFEATWRNGDFTVAGYLARMGYSS